MVMKIFILVGLMLFASSIFAADQKRTFLPDSQKFYAGLGKSSWQTNATNICGVQLGSDCWGHLIGYVTTDTKGGDMICSTLLAAKTTKTQVDFIIDVTSNHQCEIIEVQY
jgi:hypothetical protein